MLNQMKKNFQNHPIHLVSLSPWPLFTSVSLFLLKTATVLFMHCLKTIGFKLNIIYNNIINVLYVYSITRLKIIIMLIYVIALVTFNLDLSHFLYMLINYNSFDLELFDLSDYIYNINGTSQESTSSPELQQSSGGGGSTPQRGPTPDPQGSHVSPINRNDDDDDDNDSTTKCYILDYESNEHKKYPSEADLIHREDGVKLFNTILDLNKESQILLEKVNSEIDSSNGLSKKLKDEVDDYLYEVSDAKTNVSLSKWDKDQFPLFFNAVNDELNEKINDDNNN